MNKIILYDYYNKQKSNINNFYIKTKSVVYNYYQILSTKFNYLFEKLIWYKNYIFKDFNISKKIVVSQQQTLFQPLLSQTTQNN